MESINYQELLYIMSATYFFAGIIKGIIGIGLPTTGMAILCFFVNPITALGLNLIPMLISNLWQFYRADNHLKIIKEYKKFAIFIGPVGGWSFADRGHFKDKKTYKISLGKNILKADTAAIYSLSCVRALLE